MVTSTRCLGVLAKGEVVVKQVKSPFLVPYEMQVYRKRVFPVDSKSIMRASDMVVEEIAHFVVQANCPYAFLAFECVLSLFFKFGYFPKGSIAIHSAEAWPWEVLSAEADLNHQ